MSTIRDVFAARATPMIGAYELTGWLARGGSADVYAVSHPLIHRPLALKLAHRHDAHHGAARFARELQILSRLDVDGFARAYDVGRTDDGRDWLVLDRIDGLSPRDWAAAVGAPGSPRRRHKVAALGAKVARALSALHDHGLIHGDVKPHNLRVAIGGEPTLFDLGAALDLQAPISWTRFGAGLGTSRYAPPEVARRDLATIGPAADLFALGVTLAELLDEPPDGALGELLAELQRPEPSERPSALDAATRLLALGEPPPTFAPLTPLLTAHGDAISRGRGFLVDAPPGRGLLIEGRRGSGVAQVLARLAADAVDLGLTVVAYERVGLDGAVALSKARLDRAHLLVVDDLGALDTDTRRALEVALGEAAGRWAPLLLLCGRETSAATPDATTLGRRLQLITCRLAVTEADYAHAVGDPVRGLVWRAAFGDRWVTATSPHTAPALGDHAAALLSTLRAIAWPIPSAALAAAANLDDLAFVDAVGELARHDLIEAADGRLNAVGVVTAVAPPDELDWAAGDVFAFVDDRAKVAWLVASGRLDDALATLESFAPPDQAAANLDDARLLELIATRLSALPPVRLARFYALRQAWRDALAPLGPLGAPDTDPTTATIWALRSQGRLSEARALATRLLSRSRRVTTTVAAAIALARLSDDLGTPALGRYYRSFAADQAALVDAELSVPPPNGLPDDLDLALRDATGRAAELIKTIARHLDDHDRLTLGLRPEIVSLRVKAP